MDIISSAESTTLSGFAEFEKKFVYQHENESNGFRFFASKKLFLNVNKESGLEFLRIKNFGEDNEICRVKQMQVVNLHCVACPKHEHENIALGLSTGQIILWNYKTSEYTTKFSAASTNNSVLCLDFNATDEYISSVYESGIVNLYGLKTKIKMETLPFDKSCTLAKFHQTKRFHLTVGTKQGAVCVYDFLSKRRIFNSADDRHTAPCEDICMPLTMPDIMLSVGDCVIKIFDTREKRVQKIEHRYPLSTVAVSDCGKYFCVGNLNGQLIAHDLRNIKNRLNSKKIHDSRVKRVAFVPKESEDNSGNWQIFNESQTTIRIRNSMPKTPQIQTNLDTTDALDSYEDIFNLSLCEDKEKSVNTSSTKEDSFGYDALERRPHDSSRQLNNNRSSLVLDSSDSTDSTEFNSNSTVVEHPIFKSKSNEDFTAATSHNRGNQFKSQFQKTQLKSNDTRIILNKLHKIDSNFNNFRLETNAKLDEIRIEIEKLQRN